jgi:hypothetical protein
VTAFSVLGGLTSLHNTVRRHATDPEKPSSILARHFHGGDPSDLPNLLQRLSQHLETYDEGLRRYPVVFFLHTRRLRRSIPAVFATLGQLLALLRWGLPADSQLVDDPWLAALLDQYSVTVGRLQRSFVGPVPLRTTPPISREAFDKSYCLTHDEQSVNAFLGLQERTRKVTGLHAPPDPDGAAPYDRYRAWWEFEQFRNTVLHRVAIALGYGSD